MLLSYFDYIFVHLRQKARLRPELSPKFLSTLGPNPARTRPKPDPKNPARLTSLVLWSKIYFRRRQKLLPFSTIRACLVISVAKIFDQGGRHKSRAITLPEIFERKLFVERRYCRLEDQKMWPVC